MVGIRDSDERLKLLGFLYQEMSPAKQYKRGRIGNMSPAASGVIMTACRNINVPVAVLL